MFSYRHSFHAGNHADVLKHAVYLHCLQYLTQKDAALTVIDTHSGAGVYQIHDKMAQTSGEYLGGIAKLWALQNTTLPPLLQDYLDAIKVFNPHDALMHYPGSPALAAQQLRGNDRLKLYELHPTDQKHLSLWIQGLRKGRAVQLMPGSGFDSLKALLPTPSKRALIIIDPPYEIKQDYREVIRCVKEGLARLPSATILVWYPVLSRPEFHQMLELLPRLCPKWLDVQLDIGNTPEQALRKSTLTHSGVFCINPPYTLHAALQAAQASLLSALAVGDKAKFKLSQRQ